MKTTIIVPTLRCFKPGFDLIIATAAVVVMSVLYKSKRLSRFSEDRHIQSEHPTTDLRHNSVNKYY